MRTHFVLALGIALTASAASAAMQLSYVTPDGSTSTIVTASDGATVYWDMVVDTSSASPGRIMGFTDRSGASSETFNYAFGYQFGSGLIDGMDGGEIRSVGKWSISDIVMDPAAMTYTVSRDLTRDTGTATYSMDFTIGLPTVTAGGYATNVNIVDTFFFDANWVGANSDAQVKAVMRLTASADNDEYAIATHNGFTDGAPTDKMIVEATVTGADPQMAAGSTITQTLTYGLHDGAYDTATGVYSSWAGPHLYGSTYIGTTGAWAANPGGAGAERTFTADVDVDINIIPEPATLSLLGLGALALLRRRRR